MKYLKLFEGKVNMSDEIAFLKTVINWKLINFMQDCLLKYDDEGYQTYVESTLALEPNKKSNRWIIYTTDFTYTPEYLPEWESENMSFKRMYDKEAIYYGFGIFDKIDGVRRESQIITTVYEMIERKFKISNAGGNIGTSLNDMGYQYIQFKLLS